MRRLVYVALPIATVMMLAASAVLIAQHWQDFSGHSSSYVHYVVKKASLAELQAGGRHRTREAATARGSARGAPIDGSASGPPVDKATTQGVSGDPTPPAAKTQRPDSAAVARKTGSSPNPSSVKGEKGAQGAHSQHGGPQKSPAVAIGVRPTAAIAAKGVNTQPAVTHPYFLARVVASGGIQYGTTRNNGVFVSIDGGKTWAERSDGLPLRVVYPFKHDPVETITSIGVDPRDGKRVAVTTATAIYLSADAGSTWKLIPLLHSLKHSTYLTAVAVSPFQPSTIAVGTSFSGFFVTSDDGQKWVDHAKDVSFIYRGAGFDEEISALAYSPVKPGVLYLGIGFGGGVYRSSADQKTWTSVKFPGEGSGVICGMNARLPDSHAAGDPWTLRVATQHTYWSYDPASAAWKSVGSVPQPPGPSPAKRKRMAVAANRTGIYISPWEANKARLPRWISFLKKNGLNTLVVDVKDDRGDITYNTEVPFAWKIGAVHPFFNIEHLLRVAHENGIYVVGRLVVFKDKYLYRYEHHRYAIWDPRKNRPWGYYVKETDPKTGKSRLVQKEFWVDPFSEAVWRYNLSIAEELQKLGIDEIQFDYIRFPSEVTSKNAVYRFRRKGMTEEDALESFLRMSRGVLKIPISVDLFGYNSWYPNAGWVGQDIEVYSNYADVVSPMFYPSLFPRSFLSQIPYLARAKYLYRVGTWRAQRIVNGRAVIRPFVQSFLLGRTELKMDKAQYSEYLRKELEGAQEAHSSGFLLWNFGSDYYMVTFPLKPYVTR